MKHTALQRKHEQTEMDLMHTRMLAASLDGEMEEDDDEGMTAVINCEGGGEGGKGYTRLYQKRKTILEFS